MQRENFSSCQSLHFLTESLQKQFFQSVRCCSAELEKNRWFHWFNSISDIKLFQNSWKNGSRSGIPSKVRPRDDLFREYSVGDDPLWLSRQSVCLSQTSTVFLRMTATSVWRRVSIYQPFAALLNPAPSNGLNRCFCEQNSYTEHVAGCRFN